MCEFERIEMERRQFLKATAGLGILSFGVPIATSAFRVARADEEDEARRPTLVVLYQRGGMDALNAVVPYADPRYYEMRPTIALPPEDNDWSDGVIHAGKYFGFNPVMKSLMPFYEQGRMAAIVNVGSPHPTRSHFDAQDFMEYAAPGLRTIRDGWLNRYLALHGKKSANLRALAMQGLLPRSLRGSHPVLAVPSDDVLNNREVMDLFGDVYGAPGQKGEGMEQRQDEAADSVVSTGQVTLQSLERYREIVASRAGTAAGVQYPKSGLGTKLQRIAKVIKADEGLEVACVDVPGWDHHANEGALDGIFARMLKDLSDSLAAFMKDLGPSLDSTVIMTMTEFGRTCRENGNFGTDHGHGGAMFIMGGGVQGGKIYGKWTGLQDVGLYEARDLQVTTDFRDVFAAILRGHFGAELPPDFFPDYRPVGVKGLFG